MRQEIAQIRENLNLGKYQSEAAVSQGIIQRILSLLGWPVYDMTIVIPEYSVHSKRVDFALCHPPGKPVIFIEIKQVGQCDGAEEQLFTYAFFQGIPMAILTDGNEWQFFLPAEQGGFSERRVYKLDLLERDLDDIVAVLNKYLSYANVSSGKAIESARRDYRNIRQQREAINALPDAWKRLIEDGDELLIELVADKVESLCGFKPSPDDVVDFLSSFELRSPTRIAEPKKFSHREILRTPSNSEKFGFELFGEFHPTKNGRETMYEILNLLADRDSTFLTRYENLPKHGRTRRYVAKRRIDLNPTRPDLANSDEYSHEFRPGWFVDVNLSKNTITRVIELACQVADIRFDRDLKLFIR